ncbi:MAG: carboxymuconolactone decarboxylase family protein [Kiloniellaceae bacterium]
MTAKIPRLEFEDLEPALAEALKPRVKRLGYLGEFFKCTGHQPAALLSFIEFTENSKKGLPDRLVELVALTVATAMGNAYERNQHERLSVRLGFGRDWVQAVEALDPDSGGELAEAERVIQRLVIAMVERSGHGVEPELAAAVDAVGHKRAIAVMMVVGRYVTHALFVNALALSPPVPSIFEDGFAG